MWCLMNSLHGEPCSSGSARARRTAIVRATSSVAGYPSNPGPANQVLVGGEQLEEYDHDGKCHV